MNSKFEKYRWLLFAVISFVVIGVLWSIDYTYVKYHILRITPVNGRGVTQKTFEQVGDSIKVGMPITSLYKLKTLATPDGDSIIRTSNGREKKWKTISWCVCTSQSKFSNQSRMIKVCYRYNVSDDGKIIEYEKDSFSGIVSFFD